MTERLEALVSATSLRDRTTRVLKQKDTKQIEFQQKLRRRKEKDAKKAKDDIQTISAQREELGQDFWEGDLRIPYWIKYWINDAPKKKRLKKKLLRIEEELAQLPVVPSVLQGSIILAGSFARANFPDPSLNSADKVISALQEVLMAALLRQFPEVDAKDIMVETFIGGAAQAKIEQRYVLMKEELQELQELLLEAEEENLQRDFDLNLLREGPELAGYYGSCYEGTYHNQRVVVRNVELEGHTRGSSVKIKNKEKDLVEKFKSKERELELNREQELMRRELRNLINLRSPGIPNYFGFAIKDGFAKLIFEKVSGESLSTIELTESQKCDVLIDVAATMAYIHSKDVIIRNLNPDIIMVTVSTEESPPKANARISELGLAREFKKNAIATPLTPSRYRAPEIETDTYDLSVDVFAFGMITWFLLLDGKQEKEEKGFKLDEWRKGLLDTEQPIPAFIAQCVADPGKRPSFEDILMELPRLFERI